MTKLLLVVGNNVVIQVSEHALVILWVCRNVVQKQMFVKENLERIHAVRKE